MSVDIRFQAFPNDYSPDPSLYGYDFKIHVDKMPPGLSRFYNPTSLPSWHTPPYYYAVRITVTPGGCSGTNCENDGDWGEGNFTVQIVRAMPRKPTGKATNLIVLVHGCCTDKDDLREWDGLGRRISQEISGTDSWEIVVWDWTLYTPKPDPTLPFPQYILDFVAKANIAYGLAPLSGDTLAKAINDADTYQHIHLLGHSAGARVIDQAAQEIANKPQKHIHLTFLDAYRPSYDDYGSSLGDYGWHFAEHYVDKGGLPYTDDDLPHALNFDITSWQPVTSEEKKDTGHQWPRFWYEQSTTMPEYRFGYHLSKEGSGSIAEMDNVTKNWASSPAACSLTSATSELPPSCDFKNLPPSPTPMPGPTPNPPRP